MLPSSDSKTCPTPGSKVKGAGQSYQGGARQWLKVKRPDVLEICAAIIGPIEKPDHVVVGLPVENQLRIVGRSTALTAKAATELALHLHPPLDPHPWPEAIHETMLNKFSTHKGPVSQTLVEPLVVEISADTAWTGNAFRHAARYLRPRPELSPATVTIPKSHGH